MGILSVVDEDNCILSGRKCFVYNNFSNRTFSCPIRPLWLSRTNCYSVRKGGSLGAEITDRK